MPSSKATSIDENVRALLERENTLVLATTADDGSPVAAPLFYYADGHANLYWLSSPESRHSRNLSVRPRVAVAIFAQVVDWKEIRGVQLEGVAEVAPAREPILTQYRRRFGLGPELDAVIARSTMYVFRATWWRYIDSLA